MTVSLELILIFLGILGSFALQLMTWAWWASRINTTLVFNKAELGRLNDFCDEVHKAMSGDGFPLCKQREQFIRLQDVRIQSLEKELEHSREYKRKINSVGGAD